MSEVQDRLRSETLAKQYIALDIALLGAKSEGTFAEATVLEVASAFGITEDLLGRARSHAVDEGKMIYASGGFFRLTPEVTPVEFLEPRQTTLWDMLNEAHAQRNARRERGRLLLELTQNEVSSR